MTRICACLATALVLATLPLTAQANLWSTWKNSNMEPKAPDAAYRVETQGLDIRVYEWTPETAPHQTCIVMFSETGTSMQCVDKVTTESGDNS